MPFNFSGWELLIILVIGLLLFGARLPSVGRNLGKGIVEFKKGLKGVEEEVNAAADETDGKRRALGAQPGYRAPLTEGGEDRRVSRMDSVESEPRPQAGGASQ